ncbi:alpha/beta fold hydrolase [Dactylosporangium sp. CA-233914]|uniref:alpha/beta fold hydrolase n=1 Tax=Dactylosporangium sp. CA-233914 TaxID=3239934 RepID=UPI003D904FDF
MARPAAGTRRALAPGLRGAGKSDAPRGGYDKKTMAAGIHGLLVRLGLDHDVRLVGHDTGTNAYAAHPADVRRLVLSEAPIPDPAIYTFPALRLSGPGIWNLGFFTLTNGRPESMIRGREHRYLRRLSSEPPHRSARRLARRCGGGQAAFR